MSGHARVTSDIRRQPLTQSDQHLSEATCRLCSWRQVPRSSVATAHRRLARSRAQQPSSRRVWRPSQQMSAFSIALQPERSRLVSDGDSMRRSEMPSQSSSDSLASCGHERISMATDSSPRDAQRLRLSSESAGHSRHRSSMVEKLCRSSTSRWSLLSRSTLRCPRASPKSRPRGDPRSSSTESASHLSRLRQSRRVHCALRCVSPRQRESWSSRRLCEETARLLRPSHADRYSASRWLLATGSAWRSVRSGHRDMLRDWSAGAVEAVASRRMSAVSPVQPLTSRRRSSRHRWSTSRTAASVTLRHSAMESSRRRGEWLMSGTSMMSVSFTPDASSTRRFGQRRSVELIRMPRMCSSSSDGWLSVRTRVVLWLPGSDAERVHRDMSRRRSSLQCSSIRRRTLSEICSDERSSSWSAVSFTKTSSRCRLPPGRMSEIDRCRRALHLLRMQKRATVSRDTCRSRRLSTSG
mmetsp:Transcript_4964/g.16605  ORF Transcript_4964/g.16605 Transcript_4964/m.16605 type:complete len:468 (+) Transcript_4964:3539-4942(+)